MQNHVGADQRVRPDEKNNNYENSNEYTQNRANTQVRFTEKPDQVSFCLIKIILIDII
jgi:hypothetical protein